MILFLLQKHSADFLSFFSLKRYSKGIPIANLKNTQLSSFPLWFNNYPEITFFPPLLSNDLIGKKILISMILLSFYMYKLFDERFQEVYFLSIWILFYDASYIGRKKYREYGNYNCSQNIRFHCFENIFFQLYFNYNQQQKVQYFLKIVKILFLDFFFKEKCNKFFICSYQSLVKSKKACAIKN